LVVSGTAVLLTNPTFIRAFCQLFQTTFTTAIPTKPTYPPLAKLAKPQLGGSLVKCRFFHMRVQGKGLAAGKRYIAFLITPACAGKRLKKYREYANISIDYDAIHLTSHRSLKAYGNLSTHGDPASLLTPNIRMLWIIYNQLYHQSISWQAAMYLYSDYAAQVFRSGDKQKPKISVQMQRYDIQSDHFRLHQEKMTIHMLRVFLRYILRT